MMTTMETRVSEVINDDNMVGMARFPDKFFDLAVVDPPYFSGPERRIFYGQRVSSIGVNRYYKKSAQWTIPNEEYFNELIRVSNKYIIWGCNYFNYPFHSGRIVWDKVNDSSHYSDCELAATNIFDHCRVFRYMWNGMMQGKSMSQGTIMQGNKKLNEKRIHPTQKPVILYDWIFKNYLPDGGNVIDTHLGSGSSRIAADKAGNIDFYGWEVDPVHYGSQELRYKDFKSQTRLI